MWIIYAFISAIFSATAAIAEKKSLLKLTPLTFSLLLSIFNLVLSLPFLFLADFSTVQYQAILILLVKSSLGAVAFLFIMHGLKNLEISSSLPLLVLTPALTAILAFFFLKETLSILEIFGMLLLLIGTYFLQLKNKQNLLDPFRLSTKPKAYLYIIGAIVIFSITSILDKTILSNYKLAPEIFLPIQHLFFAIIFLILSFIKKDKNLSIKNSLRSSWKIILFISLITIVYRYSHILAIKAGSVALVLSVKRTSVFFATLIGGQYFKESNILRKTIATVLMILGAILIINA